MPGACPKQYRSILGKSVLQHCLESIGSMPVFSRVVLALSANDPYWPAVRDRLAPGLLDNLQVVIGGDERADTVTAALAALADIAEENDWVLVHDAVRPLIRTSDIEHMIATLVGEPAGGLLAIPVRDTLKSATDDNSVAATIDRSRLWQAQTPQMFRYGVLTEALAEARKRNLGMTDEASAIELLNLPVRLILGRQDNLKITFEEDLQLVGQVLEARNRSQS